MALASFCPIQQLALSLLLTSEWSWGRLQRLRPQETHSKGEDSRSPFYYLSRALTCFFEFRPSPNDSRLPVGTLTFVTSDCLSPAPYTEECCIATSALCPASPLQNGGLRQRCWSICHVSRMGPGSASSFCSCFQCEV